MPFADDFGEALVEIATDTELIAQSFTWNGAGYPCSATGARKRGELEQGGFGIDNDLIIVVACSQLTGGFPARGQVVTFNSTQYRIEEVLTAPGNAFLRLACNYVTKGA